MNINLDNYEQYFSMYVDNELSAADRAKVESFLQAYPYLQEEMEILQQTVLVPETISFFDKSSLLKPVLSESMENKLLLHLDNELAAAEVTALNKEISKDAFLQKEWATLQKTKLDAADTIEFPYKNELFKKEEGRIIRMPWMRWAAAAAIVGFGFYVASNMTRSTGNEINNGLATVDTIQSIDSKTAATENESKNVNDAQKGTEAVTNDTNEALNNQNTASNELVEEQRSKDENKINSRKEVLENNERASNNMTANLQPKKPVVNNKVENADPLNRNEVGLPSNEIAALQPKKLNNSIESPELAQSPTIRKNIIDEEIHPGKNGYAQTASLNFEESDNSVFLMDEENISRSKAGILLKKLKRNVERRANIKPGKSLRIAGFEFAVK